MRKKIAASELTEITDANTLLTILSEKSKSVITEKKLTDSASESDLSNNDVSTIIYQCHLFHRPFLDLQLNRSIQNPKKMKPIWKIPILLMTIQLPGQIIRLKYKQLHLLSPICLWIKLQLPIYQCPVPVKYHNWCIIL